MGQPSIIVSRFKNRHGAFSWRVDCRLNGVRLRRIFNTEEEAAVEKAEITVHAINSIRMVFLFPRVPCSLEQTPGLTPSRARASG